MPHRHRNGQLSAMVVLSKTNRVRGYLRAEDACIFAVPRLKIVQNYDVYMPHRCKDGQYFALVAVSKTNRKRGYLLPENA